MSIRDRLTLYFTVISSGLMLLVVATVYLLFQRSNTEDFYRELQERARIAAEVYLEADEISAEALQKIHDQFIASLPGETIRIYDSNNQPVFIPAPGNNWPSNTINQVRSNKSLRYIEGRRQVAGIRYDDNQGSFVVLVSAEDTAGHARLQQLFRILAGIFLGQLVIQFFLGKWFAGKTLRPVQRVNEQVNNITANDLHLRVHAEDKKDEFNTLAANFNLLLDRLEHAFDVQKMFVANASHELMTPLTTIIGEIEVVLNREREKQEYKGVLESTLTEAGRLQSIVENLLHLSNPASEMSATEIRVDEWLDNSIDYFRRESMSPILLLPGLIPNPATTLCIRGNEALLQIALHNILRNAVKFSDGQTVEVQLSLQNGQINIAVTDRGKGISANDLPSIFEPFYRGDSSRYRGNGIGLYIASRIIENHGGHINVVSTPGHGSTFNIRFTKKSPF
jgi:signal transduction histidine kinase